MLTSHDDIWWLLERIIPLTRLDLQKTILTFDDFETLDCCWGLDRVFRCRGRFITPKAISQQVYKSFYLLRLAIYD